MISEKKYKCHCCGFMSLRDDPRDPTFEICPICYWENDPYQNENPDYSGGSNKVSLNQAMFNFKKFSVIEKRFEKYIREPLTKERE